MKPITHVQVVIALALGLSAARAQEPTPQPETQKPAPQKPEAVPITPPQDDVQKEMVELFGKVERELRAIDRLLQEAARAPGATSTGSLAEQLRNAQASGESVQKDIDRILELAASQRPSSSSSGGESPPSPGGNPMDRQGEQTTGREQTPSQPKPGGEEPQPGGQEPGKGGEKPKPGGEKPEQPGQGREKPDGPQGSKDAPEQRPGSDPTRGAQGAASANTDTRDRWGELPLHAREVFRNEGGRDMPPLYREWIDAYYKRLNKKP